MHTPFTNTKWFDAADVCVQATTAVYELVKVSKHGARMVRNRLTINGTILRMKMMRKSTMLRLHKANTRNAEKTDKTTVNPVSEGASSQNETIHLLAEEAS